MPDDSLLDDNPVSGDDIADAAKSQLGTSAYQLYSYNDGVPAGEPKDHLFVSNVLGNVGLGFDGGIDKHPTAEDWADPNSNIPGWSPVSGPPQAGDVLAASKPVRNDWYFGGGQQLGIATGNNTSIGINNSTHIGENDFGFQASHDPTIWRNNQIAENQNTQLAANTNDGGNGSDQVPGKCPAPTAPYPADDCDKQYIQDSVRCGQIPNQIQKAVCGGSAMLRYGNCIAGRPLPPLYTGE